MIYSTFFFYPDLPTFEEWLHCLGLPLLPVKQKVTDLVLAYDLPHRLDNTDASSLGIQLTKKNAHGNKINLIVHHAS